ncbi:MAG: ABC transporter permease [Proteobacteria bacterium]|nr:ABC transporter permease [Pseudomonadota bacterium]
MKSLQAALTILFPIAIVLLIGAAALLAAGHDPVAVYADLMTEAFGGTRRIAASLSAATPLIFTGLAAAVAFRVGVFTVGAEGSLYVGALMAAWLGFTLTGLNGWLLAPLCLLAGTVAGTLWMLPPGLMKARLGIDEIVTTLMLNFIAIGLTTWLVNGPLLAPGAANSSTPQVVETARLTRLMPPSTLTTGFLIALALLFAYAFWQRRRVGGYETLIGGLAPRFAGASGIDMPGLMLRMLLLSGAIAGLGGALQVLGPIGRFVAGFSTGYGFTGIAVAILARGNPFGILIGAVLFGGLSTAGATIQLFSDVPIEIVNILQGLIMIFAVADFGLRGWFARRAGRQAANGGATP